ncbi:hypothetical protein HOC01_02920 [archaeon]|nr:hypothetical protein [archaeon]MBT6698157.1 hypothetical protein [archaeon]
MARNPDFKDRVSNLTALAPLAIMFGATAIPLYSSSTFDPMPETALEQILESSSGVEIFSGLKADKREKIVAAYESTISQTMNLWENAPQQYALASSVFLDSKPKTDSNGELILAGVDQDTMQLWVYCEEKTNGSFECPGPTYLAHEIGGHIWATNTFGDDKIFSGSPSYQENSKTDDCVDKMIQTGAATCYGTRNLDEKIAEDFRLIVNLQTSPTFLDKNEVLVSQVDTKVKQAYLHDLKEGVDLFHENGAINQTEYQTVIDAMNQKSISFDGYIN